MMSKQSGTKQRIMDCASELFARYGYNGTSIRDIAQSCEVNVASINYHFGSKHNLYWALVQSAHDQIDATIFELSKQVHTVEELTKETFSAIIQDKNAVRTTLKMLLAEGVPDPDDSSDLAAYIKPWPGPPGGQYFIAVLQKQLARSVPEESLIWAVRSIFSSVVHWAMMSCSSKIEHYQKEGFLNEGIIRKTLEFHAAAICEYLEKHSEVVAKGLRELPSE